METLTVSRLARQGGVNLETIRYYERQGLLPRPPRTRAGYRIFSEDAVKRLRFIKHAQKLGFSLKEIKDLLSLRVRGESSCAGVRRKAETKIADVDEKIRHLQAIRAALVELTNACSGRGPIDTCTILQALNTSLPCGTPGPPDPHCQAARFRSMEYVKKGYEHAEQKES